MIYPFFSTMRPRTYPLWALVLLMFGIWLGAQIVAIPFVLPFGSFMAKTGEPLPALANMAMTAIALLVVSVAMIIMTLAWARHKEGRGLADLGIHLTAKGWQQYRTGLGIGILFTISLILLVAVLQVGLSLGSEPVETEDFEAVWSNLADPFFWLVVGAAALLFALQSAAEEVMCRGWLLSSITARKNLPFGLFFSSFLFASLHLHYFFIDGLELSLNQMITGVFGIGAMFGMGLMLGMMALRDRSIMGAAGLHAGFNFFAVTFGMILFQLRADQVSVADTFMQSFNQSTDLNSVQAPLVVQLLLSVLVASFLFRRFGLPKRNNDTP